MKENGVHSCSKGHKLARCMAREDVEDSHYDDMDADCAICGDVIDLDDLPGCGFMRCAQCRFDVCMNCFKKNKKSKKFEKKEEEVEEEVNQPDPLKDIDHDSKLQHLLESEQGEGSESSEGSQIESGDASEVSVKAKKKYTEWEDMYLNQDPTKHICWKSWFKCRDRNWINDEALYASGKTKMVPFVTDIEMQTVKVFPSTDRPTYFSQQVDEVNFYQAKFQTKEHYEQIQENEKLGDKIRDRLPVPLPEDEDLKQAAVLAKELEKQETRLGGRIKMHGYEQRMTVAIDLILINIVDNWNQKVGWNELTYQSEFELWTFKV